MTLSPPSELTMISQGQWTLMWDCAIMERSPGMLPLSPRAPVWWMSPTFHLTARNVTSPLAPGPTMVTRYRRNTYTCATTLIAKAQSSLSKFFGWWWSVSSKPKIRLVDLVKWYKTHWGWGYEVMTSVLDQWVTEILKKCSDRHTVYSCLETLW